MFLLVLIGVNYQVVVPQTSRGTIMMLAHSTPMAGHLGVNKTCNRILSHFYWPGVRMLLSSVSCVTPVS